MFAKAFTYASLASAASAHIAMTQPTRYELDGGVINAPLYGESQAPFPCGTKTFSGVESSVWEAGSTQTVMFKGTAVHGGGSCQFSVTTDTNPTENSVWKVIKSIEGGCPAKNQAGNIEPGNNEAPLAEGYDVEIPELPQGSYTFAWTWFNKIGNREMYMNCAPIEITGGSGSVDPNSLPDMMVANIPQTSCKTTETIDIKFPDAGENVVQFGTGSYGPPEGECGGSGGQVTPPTNTDPDTPPSNQNPSTPTTSPVAPPPATTETPVDTPPSNQNPDTTVPDTPETPAGACTEGNWKCIDGSNYSRCASGAWTAPMALAVGTKCEVGEGESLNMS